MSLELIHLQECAFNNVDEKFILFFVFLDTRGKRNRNNPKTIFRTINNQAYIFCFKNNFFFLKMVPNMMLISSF